MDTLKAIESLFQPGVWGDLKPQVEQILIQNPVSEFDLQEFFLALQECVFEWRTEEIEEIIYLYGILATKGHCPNSIRKMAEAAAYSNMRATEGLRLFGKLTVEQG